MLEFKKAQLEDKELFDGILKKCECPSLEYSFTTFFLWQEQLNMEFAVWDNVLVIRSGGIRKSYLFPCGTGDIDRVLDKILKNRVSFHSLSKEQTEILQKKAPSRFEFVEARGDGDYVYEREALLTLKGKKLSSKRNHINKFVSENPDWCYEDITKDNISQVIEMHKIWCSKADTDKKIGLLEETVSVKKALENFDALRLSGGLVKAGGRVVAFSLGDPLNNDTFLVHIEKAYSEVSGAYQIINREFVRHACHGYTFINREDDAGDEGLRKAKLSYKPFKVIQKFKAREIND